MEASAQGNYEETTKNGYGHPSSSNQEEENNNKRNEKEEKEEKEEETEKEEEKEKERERKKPNKLNSCSLLELFQCKYFDGWLTVWYLHKYSFNVGVVDFLSNNLYSIPLTDVVFYLPQFCILVVTGGERMTSLLKFILDKCADSMHFAFQALMQLQSLIDSYKATAGDDDLLTRCLYIHDLTEIAAVNGHPSPHQKLLCKDMAEFQEWEKQRKERKLQEDGDDEDKHLFFHSASKKRRSEYFDNVIKFLTWLTSVSSEIILLPPEERREALREKIETMNAKIHKNMPYIPIDTMTQPHHTIVALLSEESFLIDTTNPNFAPYLIYLETIDSAFNCSVDNLHMVRQVYMDEEEAYPPAPHPSPSTSPVSTHVLPFVSPSNATEHAWIYSDVPRKKKLRRKVVHKPLPYSNGHISSGSSTSRFVGSVPSVKLNNDADAKINDEPITNTNTNNNDNENKHTNEKPNTNENKHTNDNNNDEDRSTNRKENTEDNSKQTNKSTESNKTIKYTTKEKEKEKGKEKGEEHEVAMGSYYLPKALSHHKRAISEDLTYFTDQKYPKLLHKYFDPVPEAVPPCRGASRSKSSTLSSSNEEHDSDGLLSSPKGRPIRRASEGDIGDFEFVFYTDDETEDVLLEQPKATHHAFAEDWKTKSKRIKSQSHFKNSKDWRLRSFIVKYDECRQEHLASQLITQFQTIFQEANLPLPLHPVSVLVTSDMCGLIETIPDAISLHQLYKHSNCLSLVEYFHKTYQTENELCTATTNFCRSTAAYSIVTYLLQVKDRHNGNILLKKDGHIIHIDFGYFLSNSPRSLNFEAAPFKLTQEFIDIMGGPESDMFQYYKSLVISGMLEVRRHMEKIMLLVEISLKGPSLSCFVGGDDYVLSSLRSRFERSLTEDEFIKHVEYLIKLSLNNWRSRSYDQYQYLTRGIMYT